MVDAGAIAVWYFTNTSFALYPLTGPNLTIAQLQAFPSPPDVLPLHLEHPIRSASHIVPNLPNPFQQNDRPHRRRNSTIRRAPALTLSHPEPKLSSHIRTPQYQ